MKKIHFYTLLIIFLLSTFLSPGSPNIIPVTAESNLSSDAIDVNFQKISFQSFTKFIKSVTLEKSGKSFVGIISPKSFSLPIMQQPGGQAGFVSNESDKITEFALARQYGTTGLLAHNHLAGSYFASLVENDLLILVNANKEYKIYRIEKISSFQALSPNSPYSNFVDLNNTSRILTATDLFYEVYTAEGTLVLQTCIAQGSELSWGRLFIQAVPVDEINFLDLINMQNSTASSIL
ncbi:MAG TPA: hypothetical protein VK856_06345 [Anaerolineaceae bacterium]|nr:hypothetical protein [Anaerolineaceae bacterium]